MQEVKLRNGIWQYKPESPLGVKGGFGAVFLGKGEAHDSVAIKRLHIEAINDAHREMKMAQFLLNHDHKHVIPVYDLGIDESSGNYYLVMAKADGSLQDSIEKSAPYDDIESVDILLQIVEGLSEVSSIVHRDLKPQNVLLHDGLWKVADFGIAKFVEEATSLRTLKDCLSPQYAAPEQWKFEQSNELTDIYALGCIGYALLTGEPPFGVAPGTDFKEKHLNQDPSKIEGLAAPLQILLSSMLRKVRESRPPLSKVRDQLLSYLNNSHKKSNGLMQLAKASSEVEIQSAAEERKQLQEKTKKESRKEIAATGKKILVGCFESLTKAIENVAPNANIQKTKSKYMIGLGQGCLELTTSDELNVISAERFKHSGWDVVTSEIVGVWQRTPEYEFSSSLWYCMLPGTHQYRWIEVSYYSPFGSELYSPFHLTNECHAADLAAAKGMSKYSIAFGPVPIDDESAVDFINRWTLLFAKSVQGDLVYPSHLPLVEKFWLSNSD